MIKDAFGEKAEWFDQHYEGVRGRVRFRVLREQLKEALPPPPDARASAVSSRTPDQMRPRRFCQAPLQPYGALFLAESAFLGFKEIDLPMYGIGMDPVAFEVGRSTALTVLAPQYTFLYYETVKCLLAL